MKLAKLVKQKRKELKMTIARSAELLGIAGSHLHGIESGKISRPKIEVLLKMGILYDIPSDEIIILARKIPSDVYFRITDNPQLLNIIRNYPL